jgi:hypothetical protein
MPAMSEGSNQGFLADRRRELDSVLDNDDRNPDIEAPKKGRIGPNVDLFQK